MVVRDIMTKEVLTAKADTSVNDVAKLMGQRDISGVPVIDDERHVIGIVTELDLIVRNTRLVMPHFIETLMDNGYYEMSKIMDALVEVKFDGVSQVRALRGKGQPRDTLFCHFPHYIGLNALFYTIVGYDSRNNRPLTRTMWLKFFGGMLLAFQLFKEGMIV